MPIKTDDTHLYLMHNGQMIPFSSIQIVNTLDMSDNQVETFSASELTCGFEISARISNGARDILLGKCWTNAARRTIRLNKRHKEKLRRQKLKEEIGHEHADMGRTGS